MACKYRTIKSHWKVTDVKTINVHISPPLMISLQPETTPLIRPDAKTLLNCPPIEATPCIRPHFHCRMGSLIIGGPTSLYYIQNKLYVCRYILHKHKPIGNDVYFGHLMIMMNTE